MHRKEQCVSLTLTLLNFNTTNKEEQKLWVYQRKVRVQTLIVQPLTQLVFGLLKCSSIV